VVKTFSEVATNPTTDSVHNALAWLKAEDLPVIVALGGCQFP
jgi:alcohol dehydrogenase class IV